MKKWIYVVCACLLLTGCGRAPTLETVADDLEAASIAEPRNIQVNLPDEAAAPAVEGDGGLMYLCQDYEILIQTLPGGDLEETIRQISGFGREDLTVMETLRDGVRRYDFVWASAGETGEQLGRAVVLDDGSYHYAMTVLRDAATTETSQVVWRSVFESFSLTPA